MMEFSDRPFHAFDWITGLILIIAGIYAFLHYYNFQRFRAFVKLPLTIKAASSEELKTNAQEVLLEINFFLITALLFMKFALNNEGVSMSFDNWVLYLKIIFGLGLFFTAQRLLNSFHAFITNSSAYFDRYMKVRTKLLQWSAMFIFPLLLLGIYITYYPGFFINLSLIVFAGSYVYGLLRTLPIYLHSSGHFSYHIILYLCAIEILPLILLYKLLI